MNEARPRVVVIGAGFAGLETAKRLVKVPVDVTVVDRENHHLFQPLLYQVATAELSPSAIAIPIRSVFEGASNVRVILNEVTKIRPEDKQVDLIDGTALDFDYLVVSAGARANYFGNDQWEEFSYPLKSLRDAIQVRERILLAFEAAEQEPDPQICKALLTFVVIGGGPTGVEMAGAISDLARGALAKDYKSIDKNHIRVILIEMADCLLCSFTEYLSARAKEQLEELGVEVWLGCKVLDVQSAGVQTDRLFVPTMTVIWASGVRAAPLAQTLGTALDRGGGCRLISTAPCSVIPTYLLLEILLVARPRRVNSHFLALLRWHCNRGSTWGR